MGRRAKKNTRGKKNELKRNKLDIVICSAGRFELIPYCINSIKRWIMEPAQNTDFRIIVHEDIINKSRSDKVIKWCEDNGVDKIITAQSTGVGYGKALHDVMHNHVKTKYILNMQDDFEFERTGIDIDRLLWTMENWDLWSVMFNKRANDAYTGDHLSKEYDFKGLKMVLSKVWRATPSLWNVEVAKERWQPIPRPAFPFIRSFYNNHSQRTNVKYLVENVRSYSFGGLHEPRWCRHLGGSLRSRRNTRKKSNFSLGGEVKLLLNRPPWIPFHVRPMRGTFHERENYGLQDLPEDVQKEFMDMVLTRSRRKKK